MSIQRDFEEERREHLERILQSDDRFRLVVAGAGTGKTYSFKHLLQSNPGDNLVLTFINNLAHDMAEDLQGLAEVRTFHSYCRRLLHNLPSDGIDVQFHFFPKLGKVVASDACVLRPEFRGTHNSMEDAFDEAFEALIEDDGRIEFFLERASFYNAVGFDDSVYRVLACFRRNPDTIPVLHQLILDEYQDFNALEVEFIRFLESRSPVLIVGDDDQAIYDFRYATADHLRAKAHDPKFTKFSLPFCSRCTEVIVEATHSVIDNARTSGLLKERLEKEFVCYTPDKRVDSEAYPQIVHAECSVHNKRAPYMSKYIGKTLQEIPQREVEQSLEEQYPLALIVGPSHYLTQIHNYLANEFSNVVYKPRIDMSLTSLDGYLPLLENEKSNLGWRVLLELETPDFVRGLIAEARDKGCGFLDIIDAKFREKHQKRLTQLRSLWRTDNPSMAEGSADLEHFFGIDIGRILEHMGRALDQDMEDVLTQQSESAVDEPLIRLTTYSGCKGLSAGFTFVTGLEDGVFPRRSGRPVEREVCQFIVALTRTRKQCHLISIKNFAGKWLNRSVFLRWIANHVLERTCVNKAYLAN